MFRWRGFGAILDGRYLIVNITSAIFDRSAPDLESCPDESLPEFAFIGRSNVGKSSLLNMLAGAEGLARVSTTPGFTKLINIFTMNRTWRLVDLPGYGFAQVARKDSSRFNQMATNYLEHRANLCCVFALLNSGLTPQQIDVDFVQWLTSKTLPFVLVFTKTDKISATARQANIAAFAGRISAWFEQLPTVLTCSAKTGQGREELLGVIDEELRAIKAGRALAAPDVSQDAGRKAGASDARKSRPDRARPW